jgi:hypothetical protein
VAADVLLSAALVCRQRDVAAERREAHASVVLQSVTGSPSIFVFTLILASPLATWRAALIASVTSHQTQHSTSLCSDFWDPYWELDERNLSEAFDNGDIEKHDFRCQIELMKTFEMDNSTSCIVHCVDCQPLVLNKDMDGPHWCECDGLFGHFCQEWRCIPCVLVEETKLITRGQHREPYVCPCGKMAFVGGMETFGLCGKIQCWAPDQEKLNVERMRLQLGTMTGDRADDPILSQLRMNVISLA